MTDHEHGGPGVICSRCRDAPATCEAMILSAQRGYPRLVMCAPCYQAFDWDAAGRAFCHLMRVFDGATTLLSREQIRRVRFLLYHAWDDEEDPEGSLYRDDGDQPEWSEALDILRAQRFAEELARVESPVELHYFAMGYNWGDGDEKLRAVLDHPLCDLGTATMIYWLSQPDLILGWEAEGDADAEGLALIKDNQARLVAEDYAHRQIRFDPRDFLGNDHTQPEADSTGMSLIPPKLTEATPGRALEFLGRL